MAKNKVLNLYKSRYVAYQMYVRTVKPRCNGWGYSKLRLF